MFKKRCSHCNSKVERDFDFCPYCAAPQKDIEKEYGLLGKNDSEQIKKQISPNNSSFMDKLIGSAVSSAMKMFEKELGQMNHQEKQEKAQPKSELQLYINGQRIPLSNTQIQRAQNSEENAKKILNKAPKISDETLKKSVKLPRKEAKTKLTRLKDKVIYEFDTPGLSSLNDVIINQLENSIEIKAYTERAVFIKTLKVKLPLHSYSIRQDKLFLEFGSSQ